MAEAVFSEAGRLYEADIMDASGCFFQVLHRLVLRKREPRRGPVGHYEKAEDGKAVYEFAIQTEYAVRVLVRTRLGKSLPLTPMQGTDADP